jgi:PAS domain S-box-containing protein
MNSDSKIQTSNSKVIKILLIEDNPGDADLIEEMLDRTDVRFELKCVERLSLGIEQLQADRFDIILLDLGLPDSHGLDTLMKLNESKPEAPVIVLTGLADETVGTEAVKAGAQDYLIKGQIDKKLFARSIKYAIERAQVEAEREQYFKFFQTSADLMCFADPNGAFMKTNPAFSETLGYTEAELVSKPFIAFVHPEDKQATLDEMASQLQKGFTINFENRYVCKDGSLRWLSWRAIYNTHEGITYATARDITKRKQTEDKLRESEEKFRNIFDSAMDGILIADIETHKFMTGNNTICRMLGYTMDEIGGLGVMDIHHEKDMPYVMEQLEKLVRRKIVMSNDIPVRRKDGSIFYADISTSFITFGDKACLMGIFRDITERRKAEKALRKSEEFNRSILESVDEGFIVIDRDYRIVSANRAFAEQTWKALEEITGKLCFEISHHCVAPCWEDGKMCAVKQVFDTGETRSVVHTHYDVKGAPIYVETKAYPLSKDESGKVTTVIEIIVDITEKKKAEERLKLLNECFLEFGTDPLENINHLVALCGTFMEGTCALYNRLEDDRLCSWGQWNVPPDYNSIDAPEGHICFDVIKGNSDEVVVIRNLPETAYAGTDPNVTRYNLQTYVGIAVKCADAYVGSLCVVFQKDFQPSEDDKRILGIIASAIGIEEERKKTEETLEKLTHKIGLILNSAGEGIYGLDLEGKVTFINPAGARMMGYEAEELLGRQSHATWHHHNPDGTALPIEKCSLNEVLKEGLPGAAEDAVFWKKDGTNFPVEYSSTPMFEADKLIGAVVTFKDITSQLIEEQERKKLEEQLRHAQKMEAVGTLTGGIAHDFNNILNVIIGFGTMVADRIGDDPLSKEQMNEVLTAAERAANLTKRLLAFSRKQVVEAKPININELILGLQKMLVRIIRESIDFKLDLAESPLMVLADAGQIEQVLMNLAANARDAMLEGGRLTIGTEIKELDDEYVAAYGYGKPGKYALITVTDTGQGMDERTKEKIFEPFFTTKGIGEGTGLGLAISYGIIKQHDGYIKVYSELGKGTEFKIYLPLMEDSAALEKATEALVSVKGGKETILVAEDDASLRKLSRIVLESYGYSVITAEDGEDAITKFMENRESISLALIDMIMPKKNGKEVGETIKKASPLTKILFVSGYTMDKIKTEELTESGFDFIHKPVRPQDLLKKVREALDRKP